MASTLLMGAPAGMQMTEGMPSRAADRAMPWAWFPAEQAMTPFSASSGVRDRILLKAPRSLKEPVSCKFSALM